MHCSEISTVWYFSQFHVSLSLNYILEVFRDYFWVMVILMVFSVLAGLYLASSIQRSDIIMIDTSSANEMYLEKNLFDKIDLSRVISISQKKKHVFLGYKWYWNKIWLGRAFLREYMDFQPNYWNDRQWKSQNSVSMWSVWPCENSFSWLHSWFEETDSILQ